MTIKNKIKEFVKAQLDRFGYEIHTKDYIRDLINRNQANPSSIWVPNGHFYSPYPNLDEIRASDAKIFNLDNPILGIDLREEAQLAWLEKIKEMYKTMPAYEDRPVNGLRYYYSNANYAHSDGIILHSMLRIIKPKRVIEVGSGFSSAMTLDTNELFFDNKINLTFIDPYPERLLDLLKPQDHKIAEIIPSPLQEVDASLFTKLQAGDILFIDSTHVSKINSDVNHLFFKILPLINKGVYIHIHDIFFPFEYPRVWVYEGRVWSEIYLLQAFLQYNPAFQIEYFQNMMYTKHLDFFANEMPLCLKNGGDNIWLQKIA